MLNRGLVFPFLFVLSKLFHILQCYHRNSKIRETLLLCNDRKSRYMLLLCYDIKSKNKVYAITFRIFMITLQMI